MDGRVADHACLRRLKKYEEESPDKTGMGGVGEIGIRRRGVDSNIWACDLCIDQSAPVRTLALLVFEAGLLICALRYAA